MVPEIESLIGITSLTSKYNIRSNYWHEQNKTVIVIKTKKDTNRHDTVLFLRLIKYHNYDSGK